MSIRDNMIQQVLGNPGKYSIQQLQQAMKSGSLPAYVVVPIIQDKVQQQKQMQAAMAMQQQQEQQPPVVEQIMQEAAQMGGGVEQLPSNLPQEYAQGGIVAFTPGGVTDSMSAEIGGGYEPQEPRVWNPFTGKYEPLTEEQKKRLEEGGAELKKTYGYTPQQPEAAPAPVPPAAPPPQAAPNAAPFGFGAPRGLPKVPADKPFGSFEQFTRQETTALQEAEAARRAGYEQQRKEVEGRFSGKAYETLEKQLQEEAQKAGADKNEAKYMAIFEAGLAMMGGTSQNAFENIAKGAQVGVGSYKSAVKDLKQAEKENRRMQASIDQARRAESLGDRDRQLAYMEKAYNAETESGRAMVNAIMKARGVDREEALKIWEVEYKGATSLEGARIAADSRAEALMLRGLMGGEKGGMTAKQRGDTLAALETSPKVIAYKKELLGRMGSNAEKTPQFQNAVAEFVNQEYRRLYGERGIPSGSPAGFTPQQLEFIKKEGLAQYFSGLQ